ncbi:helix-turn-helix domain-containing protein (plasmid) [Roseibium aggregatum]|nr:helix-turn-helix domain-containing protein [Roseibium aggregatum]
MLHGFMTNSYNHFAPKLTKYGPRERKSQTLVCVTALAGVPEWVRDTFGARVLNAANRAALIDIERIENLDCFIPHASMAAFVETVSQRAGIPNLGLLLAPELSFESFGKWSEYVVGAATLGSAIERAAGSIGYHSYGDRVSLSITGTTARFAYFSATRGLAGYQHDAVGTIGVMLSFCRLYLAKTWLPFRIELDISKRPGDFESFEDCFQCPVLFGCPEIAIVFDKDALEGKRSDSISFPMTTIEDLARARLEPATRQGLIGAICTQVRTQVLAGSVSTAETAYALDVSVRTLQRELNCAGLTYRDLVAKLRFERASELLRDGSLNVAQIALNLGYSNSAHFARAFRKTCGLAPTEFRMKADIPQRN